MSDADGLKAFNDNFGYDAGDALLKAKADALREAGVDAYHDKGDEFLYRGDSEADLKQKLENARKIYREGIIAVNDGDDLKRFKGADFSYGTGSELKAAEAGLKKQKSARKAAGQTERGQFRGITEVGPEEGAQSQGSTGTRESGAGQQDDSVAPRAGDGIQYCGQVLAVCGT
jgi:GGDEF domain-containing protein